MGAQQDGGVRRELRHRLDRAGFPRPPPGLALPSPAPPLRLELRHHLPYHGAEGLRAGLVDGSSPASVVLPPTRRRLLGLPLSEEAAGRDQETGSLAERQLRQEVREGGLGGSGGEQAVPFDDSLRRQDPRQPRRLLHAIPPRSRAADDQGDETHLAAGTVGRSASARELWKTAVEKEVNRARQHGLRGKVFLDIFSGAKGIAQALRTLGCGCVPLEVSDETWQDVTHSALQQQVLSFICRGLCAGIWLATPCATWSTARWGQPGSPGGPLRSAASPWGHPAALARSLDREKIELGNRTAKFTLKIIRAAIKHHTPVAVENPAASRLWQILRDEGLFQVGTSMVTDPCW